MIFLSQITQYDYQDMGDEGIVEDNSTLEEVSIFHKGALQTVQFQVMVERDSGIFDIAADVNHLKR